MYGMVGCLEGVGQDFVLVCGCLQCPLDLVARCHKMPQGVPSPGDLLCGAEIPL